MKEVHTTVYADALLVKNMIQCFLLLFSVILWQKNRKSVWEIFLLWWKKLLLYSFIWALLTILCLLLPGAVRFPVSVVVELLWLLFVMVRISVKRRAIIGTASCLIVSVLYYSGGLAIMHRLDSFLILPFDSLWYLGILVILLIALLRYNKMRKNYIVTFRYHGHSYRINALLDTGNLLREPMTGRAVSILEERVLLTKGWKEQGFFCIPYHSVGTPHGLLPGILMKDITIENGNESWHLKEMMIAMCPDRLSSGKKYEMLLHTDYLDTLPDG